MQHKKLLVGLSAIFLAVAIAFAAESIMWSKTWNVNVQVGGTAAVQYTIITDLVSPMNLDQEYPLVVQCTNTAKIPYEVKAYLKCVGPGGFDANDIFVRWKTYNETGHAWIEFASGITEFYLLGRLPSGYAGGIEGGSFTSHDGYWIDWTGTYTTMNPGVTYTQYLWVTIYGSAPTGSYTISVDVTGEGV